MATLLSARPVAQLPARFKRGAVAIGVAVLFATRAVAAEYEESDVRPRPVPPVGQTERVEFESGFIRAMGQSLDLSRFERDESVTEGDHPQEVIVNGTSYGTHALRFSRRPASGKLEPCFPKTLVVRFGLHPDRQLRPLDDGECAFLDELVDGGGIDLEPGEQQLSVTIPQYFLRYNVRGYVPPDALDDGITAAMFRYNFSYTNNQGSRGNSGQYLYGGLESSFNYGPWRFRSYGTLSSNENQPTRWDHVAAYAQRALPKMQAEVTIGDANTTGQLFDTTPVRGMTLSTDDRMLPDSLRGYAPVVRGVARSNAVVTIRQASNVIFEANVPPGEFAFNDLYATGYGGDLEVTVTEADGQTQKFNVPYGSIAQLLRENYTRYSVTAGTIRDSGISHAPVLMEATIQHGLTNDITVYGGVQITAPVYYAAAMAGAAVNTPLGALGLDLTQSYALCGDFAHHCNATGHSVRASLGKQLPTGTYFSLVGYRYSSPGYYSLMDAMYLREYRSGRTEQAPQRLRDRFDMNVTQTFGEKFGSLFFTGSYGRRWEDNGRTLTFQAGYSNSIGKARYNISLGRTHNATGDNENSVFLSLSMPLGRSDVNPATLGVSASHTDGRSDVRTSVTGSLGDRAQGSYSTWFDAATGGNTSFGGALGYTADAAKGSVSYGRSPHTNSFGGNLSGGVVIHGGGVNFASELGSTVALVEAEGAMGARVLPYQHTRIDRNGTAIVPYVTPYQWNNVELDLKGADMGLQVDNTRIMTAPTSGAVVRIRFDSKHTESAVLRLRRQDGSLMPFGATVADADGNLIGTVGGGGTVIASGLPGSALLTVTWGDPSQQCLAPYTKQQPSSTKTEGVQVQDVTCQPVNAPHHAPDQKMPS